MTTRATHDSTDLRNAERLVKLHGSNIRFVHAWRRWLVWNGSRWATDDTGGALRLAADTARAMLADALVGLHVAQQELAGAVQVGDDAAERAARKKVSTAGKAFDWAAKSQNAARLHAMLDVARADASVAVRHEELDADRWLLNVQNGTIDLRTGKLRPHDRRDLLSKLAPVTYDPQAA